MIFDNNVTEIESLLVNDIIRSNISSLINVVVLLRNLTDIEYFGE